MVKENATHYVYGLVDPNDLRIKYVGLTHDIRFRFDLHKVDSSGQGKSEWFRELEQAGQDPILIVFAECSLDDARVLEREVVLFLQSLGSSEYNSMNVVRDGKIFQSVMYKLGELTTLLAYYETLLSTLGHSELIANSTNAKRPVIVSDGATPVRMKRLVNTDSGLSRMVLT